MQTPSWRAFTWIAVFIVIVFAWRAGLRFPWQDLTNTLTRAQPGPLVLAAVVSLLALGAKGWAWHLLLQPVAPHRWSTAQEANLVGAAVNYISVAVMGEAARIRLLVTRDPVPVSAAVSSVVWARAIEGIGLALFILAGGLALKLPTFVRDLEIGAAVLLAGLLGLVWFRGWHVLPSWIPGPLRRAGTVFGQIGSWRRIPAPLALALFNWFAQWATYHLTLAATGIPTSLPASFTATLASNVGGALRLTPANVGITQASIALALLPFGVKAPEAIAASVILQALQVLPVLGLALAVVGWKGLGQLRAKSEIEV
jgi:uncharacterized membrane protein YbhN (UPF0104 family)